MIRIKDSDKYDEQVLLKRISQGDSKAFELLFLKYYPKTVSFIDGFIKDKEMARDLSQDLFLSVWDNRQRLSTINSFSAYLFRAAHYMICNYYKSNQVHNKYKIEHYLSQTDFEDAEEIIFVREIRSLIDHAVENMPAQRQKIYRMSREQGYSNDRIAEILNIDKRTVENHITAALKTLRKIICLCGLFLQ